MSFLKCAYCGHRMHAGVTYVYWFAPLRSGDVFRVRQRLCDDCFAFNVDALLTPDDAELLACSACGISVEDDVFPIYVTYVRKGADKVRGAMALCEEHNLEMRARADKDSTALADRDIDERDAAVAHPAFPAHALFNGMGRVDPGARRA